MGGGLISGAIGGAAVCARTPSCAKGVLEVAKRVMPFALNVNASKDNTPVVDVPTLTDKPNKKKDKGKEIGPLVLPIAEAVAEQLAPERPQRIPRARTAPKKKDCSNQPDISFPHDKYLPETKEKYLATREQQEAVCEIVSTSQHIATGTTAILYPVPEGFKKILQCRSDNCIVKLVDSEGVGDKLFQKEFYLSEKLRKKVENNYGNNAALIPKRFLFSPRVDLPPDLNMGMKGFVVVEKAPGIELAKLFLQLFIQTIKEDPEFIRHLEINLPDFANSLDGLEKALKNYQNVKAGWRSAFYGIDGIMLPKYFSKHGVYLNNALFSQIRNTEEEIWKMGLFSDAHAGNIMVKALPKDIFLKNPNEKRDLKGKVFCVDCINGRWKGFRY